MSANSEITSGPFVFPRGEIAEELASRVAIAARSAFDVTLVDALIRPGASGRGGDYQCNVAMSLAKQLGKSSRAVAQTLVDALDVADMAEPPSIGGPGFINFALRPEWLAKHLIGLASDERFGAPLAAPAQRVVIDLSSPNVAKEMHVGHLRSTIIGDALARLLSHVGHKVVRQNHIGDWGTPFGMLIEHMRDLGWGNAREGGGTSEHRRHSIGDLNVFYQEARQKFDSDPEFAERSRGRVVALQQGDGPTIALWQEFVAESERHFLAVYDLLQVDISAADTRGESSYNSMLPEIAADLEQQGLASLSAGALCVFPEGFSNKDGEPLPLIVRKRDGGYNYDTTDLACIRYRVEHLKGDDLIYVVDAGQSLHFQMVFAVARAAGWLPPSVRVEHVTFGVVLGENGRRLRTRSGESVKLVELLNEAVQRADEVIAERTELDDSQRGEIARAVGIGAVKYADLSSDRTKDYVFSWKRMLAMEGNTSVYLQYAHARICSVLRKAAAVDGGADYVASPLLLHEPAEHALALTLVRLPAALAAAVAEREPHRWCGYLYELATTFSTFYERCPILTAPTAEVRASRLRLARITGQVLAHGLSLVGIAAPARL